MDDQIKMEPDDVYYSDTRGRNLFGYRVDNNSIEPMFRRGDILVVNPNLSARPGDLVVARCGETTVLGRMDASGIFIESLTKEIPPLPAADVETLGRVVEKKRIYK